MSVKMLGQVLEEGAGKGGLVVVVGKPDGGGDSQESVWRGDMQGGAGRESGREREIERDREED